MTQRKAPSTPEKQAEDALSDAALDKITGGDDKKAATPGQMSNLIKTVSDTASGVVQNLK
jgi:hypothetical protein